MTFATAFCLIHLALSIYFRAYSFFVRLCSTTRTWRLSAGEKRIGKMIYLAEGPFANSFMEVEMVKIYFTVKVDGVATAADDGSHIS